MAKSRGQSRWRGRAQVAAKSASHVRSIAIAVVGFLLLAGYVVVRNADRVRDVTFPGGGGIAFHDRAEAPPLAEQHERAAQLQSKVVEAVQAAPAVAPAPSASELTGVWQTPDGAATWTVTVENGYLVFREMSVAAPGVVAAIGYGAFHATVWDLKLETMLGESGEASLVLEPDGSLQGEAIIDGERVAIRMVRASAR